MATVVRPLDRDACRTLWTERLAAPCDFQRAWHVLLKRFFSRMGDVMKKAIGILAVALAVQLSARADWPRHPDPEQRARCEQRFREVETRLALAPEQIDQVRPILIGTIEVMKAVRGDYVRAEGSPSTRRRLARELRAIEAHADARLRRILTWDQMEELRTIRRQWRDEVPTWAVLTK
jgi:hypothetical protein